MRVLILGGDGYLGWPTAMHMSAHGHNVAVADNYLRRRMAMDEDVEPLILMPNLRQRVRIWEDQCGDPIKCYTGDLRDWTFMSDIFREFQPDSIIHYAEQPSAPYSMLSHNAARLTLQNNIEVTFNLVLAVKQFAPDAQIVKLGTMGEYGTPDIDIEEGWIEINHKGRRDKFLYPRQASSLYHTTKIMDTDLLWFYVRMWDIRVTDLMQGPVYGVFTDENRDNKLLHPFFSYDELFGTVLNRFVVQAVADYPLTVYGKGGQTRGYLNLIDTLNCIRISVDNPAGRGELRIFNQFTETFSVNELADKVRAVSNELGFNVKIKNIQNPRIEKEEHYYNPKHTGLLDLGLQPTYLTDSVIAEMVEYVAEHKNNIKHKTIYRGTQWA